jgi:hypothetical protein
MSDNFSFRKGLLPVSIAAVLAAGALSTAGCQKGDAGATGADGNTQIITGVEFTNTPAPTSNADRIRTVTSSKAIVSYADGSSREFPLSFDTLFQTTDTIGSNPAGQLYDASGSPLLDANNDPVVVETADGNSLLSVGGNTYLVTHYEYDNILADGSNPPSRMPMSMTLTSIAQDATSGDLSATAQSPIDFSGVDGLWIPCFASQSPWNTHLGSEEDYDLYFVNPDGTYGSKTTAGLSAITNLYFNNTEQANPYNYGFIPEVTVAADGSTSVAKHYSMGRGTWEMTIVMPDSRTAYYGDDGTNVGMFMYIADQAEDLSAGTLYAAKWNQIHDKDGGAATLSWIKLGHASDAEVRALIDAGTDFWDIFDITTPTDTPTWDADGYREIRAGQSSSEYIRLKAGMEQAAAFLEPRRYAAYLGATTEFNKMEGVAKNATDKKLYMAMSYIDKGMKADATGPVDHIQVAKVNAGATYEIKMAGNQLDTNGDRIQSEWVGTSMYVPVGLLGEDIVTDSVGNTANPDKVANPDNVFFSDKMRTLFIGEDSGTHVNNYVWAYNVDTGNLSRILSLPAGAEATGLQVVDNLGGHAYIMANNQHQGDWLSSMPTDVVTALETEAKNAYGVNAHGTPNYYLDAKVGYIGGLPGF